MTSHLKPWVRAILAGLLFVGSQAQAHQTDLLAVYYQAQHSDPTFLKAKQTLLATKEALPQSIAALFPNIVVNGTASRTWQRVLPGPTGLQHAHGESLTLTQPIINFASWDSVREASSAVKAAVATYAAAKQDLMIRVANAYFNVLLAKDTLRFTRAEKLATSRQLDQARERYKVGLVAITTVYQARAGYDQVVASEIGAENTLKNAREQLRQLTGKYYDHLASLRRHIPLVRPTPKLVSAWTKAAISHNYTLNAARYNALAMKTDISVKFSGHLPSVSAVGTLSRNDQINPFNPGSDVLDTRTRAITLQLAIPVFAGGMVNSQTRQARHVYGEAAQDLENTYRQVVVATRQNYNNIILGLSKIQADRQSVHSYEASLRSTEAAYKVGTSTIIDVLNTQKNLFQAQKAHAEDQYTYINDSLALKEAAGSLSEKDLMGINNWLSTDRN